MDAEQRDRRLAELDYLGREAEAMARRDPHAIELAAKVAMTRAMVWRSTLPQPAADAHDASSAAPMEAADPMEGT